MRLFFATVLVFKPRSSSVAVQSFVAKTSNLRTTGAPSVPVAKKNSNRWPQREKQISMQRLPLGKRNTKWLECYNPNQILDVQLNIKIKFWIIN